MINAYNRRQLMLMRDSILRYPKNNTDTVQLMSIAQFIEGIVSALEDVDEKWKGALLTERWELEIIYSVMLDKEIDIISEESSQEIAIALENIKNMIDIALGISFKEEEIENNHLLWVLNWYKSQWDVVGDEQRPYIKIISMSTPGWQVELSLDKTEIQDRNFQMVESNRSDNDWVNCFVLENVFHGFGGQYNLMEILQIFREWAEECEKEKGL